MTIVLYVLGEGCTGEVDEDLADALVGAVSVSVSLSLSLSLSHTHTLTFSVNVTVTISVSVSISVFVCLYDAPGKWMRISPTPWSVLAMGTPRFFSTAGSRSTAARRSTLRVYMCYALPTWCALRI